MSSELTYHQILELLPAYTIGALEPDEMLAVDAYLKDQQDLLSRLRQLEAATTQLAYVAPDTPLPANAKSQLMMRVQAEVAETSVTSVTAFQPAPPLRRPVAPESSLNWLTRLRLTLRTFNPWAIATGCALLALILLAVYVSQLQSRLGQMSAQLDTLQTEINQLQITNNQLQQQQQADRQILALIANTTPERVLQLPGTAELPQASGIFYGSSDSQGVLVLHGLTPLPPDQTYQLWLIPADGPPESAGLLAVPAAGPTWLTVDVPSTVRNFAKVGVSLEPAGGSPVPTKVVLLGPTG